MLVLFAIQFSVTPVFFVGGLVDFWLIGKQ